MEKEHDNGKKPPVVLDFVTQMLEKKGIYSLARLPQAPPLEQSTLTTWWELDQIWKVYPGQFTLVTGLPGHGKSTFLLNIIVQLYRLHRVRSFLYTPENQHNLMRKLKNIWGEGKGEAEFGEFIRGSCFVQSSEIETEEPHDLGWVIDAATDAVKWRQTGLLVIDPWNELEHAKPPAMPMTDYIREALMYLKRFNRQQQTAVMLVVHPTKAVCEADGRTPRLSDCEGSMSWNNKCDNGLVIQRDSDKSVCKVSSQKCREEPVAGKVGACWFTVDPKTGIFVPQYGATT